MVARFTQSGYSPLLGIHKRPEIGLIGRAPVDIPRMQVLLQAKHVALPFYSLQTRCLSHPIVLSRLSRPCELNDRFRLCRPRRYLLCAHQFAADSVRVDGGRLAHPKARARPVVKDSFQTVFGMFIWPHHEKSGFGKENVCMTLLAVERQNHEKASQRGAHMIWPGARESPCVDPHGIG